MDPVLFNHLGVSSAGEVEDILHVRYEAFVVLLVSLGGFLFSLSWIPEHSSYRSFESTPGAQC